MSLLGSAVRGATTLSTSMISGSVRTLQTIGSAALRSGGSTALVAAPKAITSGVEAGAKAGAKAGAGAGLSKTGLAMVLGGGGLGAYLMFGRKPPGSGGSGDGSGDGSAGTNQWKTVQGQQFMFMGLSSLLFLACCCCCCILVLLLSSN